MSAIITDNIRLLNARNFVNSVTSDQNAYYTFLGLTNSTDYVEEWESNPPRPRDAFDQENDYWDTMISLKRINSDDIMYVVPRIVWSSGTKYDMYRHDYTVSNLARVSRSTNLYSSLFYVMNSDFRVYICLQNGTDPNNPEGKPSLDEPTFTDLEPRVAGSSGDGYIWKYLYTLNPSDIVRFDSTKFIPVPKDWNEVNSPHAAIKNNAVSGSIKIVTVTSKGELLNPANTQYTQVPIVGDGDGAFCTITVDENSQVSNVEVSNQGSGYTFGTVDLSAVNFPEGTETPEFDVIISPQGGHGYDIYKELGAFNVLLYARIENDVQDPDFIRGNKLARVGIVENPLEYQSTTILDKDKASAVGALKLTGVGYSSAVFDDNTIISQTISAGTTAYGRVVSYDNVTGVLKYWQDRSIVGFNTYTYPDISTNTVNTPIRNTNSPYGYDLIEFSSSPEVDNGGSLNIIPQSGTNSNLLIDNEFTGVSTSLNNSRIYYLGLEFIDGIAPPEVQKHSGNIIYVDNRPSIVSSSNQKEDIKIVLQF